jgi:hypothetical protein
MICVGILQVISREAFEGLMMRYPNEKKTFEFLAKQRVEEYRIEFKELYNQLTAEEKKKELQFDSTLWMKR